MKPALGRDLSLTTGCLRLKLDIGSQQYKTGLRTIKTMENIIEVNGLEYSYGNFKAVDGISFLFGRARYSHSLDQMAQERAQSSISLPPASSAKAQ